MGTYTYPRFAYRRPADFDAPARHRIVVVGGGLVGLTAALDLARRGNPVVLLDDDDTVSTGSRAICFAKRTLEIYGRLGLGRRLLEKGVTWNTGRVYFGEREIYHFDLLPDSGHACPAFVNLQQYYVEQWLVEACIDTGLVDLRWKNRVCTVTPQADGATLDVETPDGHYRLDADFVLACDGARSLVRDQLGLPFIGQVFHDRFLIADVVMHAEFPSERRFWFDPPFHPGGSVLLHRQPDDVWRIDFQLGADADPRAEQDPERVRARVRAMLGPDIAFDLEWISVYTFRCRRLENFTHGHVIFLGDAAHQVSPFGARGGNAGVQDADNLAWKLDAVLRGIAPAALLDSYDAERIPANDENILNSTRSTDFITPKHDAARALRDAVLHLAARHRFARSMVNSGRLSRPAMLTESPLGTRDAEPWDGGVPPGAPAIDAPLGDGGWLLDHLRGNGFALLLFGRPAAFPSGDIARLAATKIGISAIFISDTRAPDALWDRERLIARRYAAPPGAVMLFRPDQHVAARWRAFDEAAIGAAQRRALAAEPTALRRAG